MNLYWPVYKRLENEVLECANYIFFSDNQLKVHSLVIGNLIVRCAIEIESLAKELYVREGGNPDLLDEEGKKRDLYFDTDCLEFLNQKWNICEKKVSISSTDMFFEEFRELKPLKKSNKRGTSGSKWKQAYQNIKHDRVNQIKKFANVENLMNALAALFILNIYYSDEDFWTEEPMSKKREYREDIFSSIFTVKRVDATHITMAVEMGDGGISDLNSDDVLESIYIEKFTDMAFENIHRDMCVDNLNISINIKSSAEYKNYCLQNPGAENEPLIDVAKKIGLEFYKKYILRGEFSRNFNNNSRKKETRLNKGGPIYPELRFEGFLLSEEGKELALKLAQL